MTQWIKTLLTSAIIGATICALPAQADIYQIFWPEENLADPENDPSDTSWQNIKITNISSNTVVDGTLSGVYSQDLSGMVELAEAANANVTYQLERGLGSTGQGPVVLDFTGTTLKFRSQAAIALNPQGGAGETYVYDAVYEVNPKTGELISTRLVATTEESATLADQAGFEVDLELSQVDRSGTASTFQSYATNITNTETANIETSGGLVTEQLSNLDGTSLLRKEDDGTVHIGQNSIVLADELVSTSGRDEIYSTSGVLQLGDTDTHQVVIKGDLIVDTPTAANHAANKAYVDQQNAATLSSANRYSNAIGAMTMAASQISLTASPDANLSLGVGLGHMQGENAFAIGLSGKTADQRLRYSFTASYNDLTGTPAYGAGISWSLR